MTKRTSPFRVKPLKAVTLVALLTAGAATQGVPAAEYTFSDLGTLGGSDRFASDLNESGQVVGARTTMDQGFSVVQRAEGRRGWRLGFAIAIREGPEFASYSPAKISAFHSTGGASTATRTAEGHYAMHFVGLQKLPERTEHA